MRIVRSADRPTVPASHEDPRNPGVYKKSAPPESRFANRYDPDGQLGSVTGGQEFAAHYHEDMQEVFIMLAGTARIQVATNRPS